MGKHLSRAVNQVAKARSKNQIHVHLQDILIKVSDNECILRATDLEISCEKSIPVKGIVNGNCTIKGDTIIKILSMIEKIDSKLDCELVDGVFTITTEKGLMEIKTNSFEDFPTLPPLGDFIGEVSKKDFISLIKSVSFCVAQTDIKPEIASVYVYNKENDLVSVATDSFRLAEQILPLENKLEISVLIPGKHINDIVTILNDEDGDVLSLSKHEGILSFSIGDLTLSVFTVGGSFPDYKQLFPKEFNSEVLLSKQDLQKALSLTTYFNEQFQQVKCVFGESSVTFHSRNQDIGQITHTIDAKLTGDVLECSYNNRYFLDSIPNLQGDKISLSFTSAMRPVVVKSIENNHFTYLLMPLNR